MYCVIDGLDGSGKETQSKMLSERLGIKRIEFPNYDSLSSLLVRMYLSGTLKPNPKVASFFYAIDRFITMKMKKQDEYLILDRYTTSNMVHQVSRLNKVDWEDMIKYIEKTEYEILRLPKPDIVIALIVPPNVSRQNVLKRGNELDIHEKDINFYQRSYDAMMYMCDKYKWEKVKCVDSDNKMRSREDIHEDIMEILDKRGFKIE